MAIPNGLTGQALLNFIGGRNGYNSQRRCMALDRRYRVMYTWVKNPHLNKADLARMFGVNRSTITRDIQRLKADEKKRRRVTCPLCDGKGKLDTGRGLATEMEIVSEVRRKMPHLFYYG